MKAIILQPFTMGVEHFQAGATVELESWRLDRLEGEGLVRAVPGEAKAAVKAVAEPIKQPEKRAKSRRK